MMASALKSPLQSPRKVTPFPSRTNSSTAHLEEAPSSITAQPVSAFVRIRPFTERQIAEFGCGASSTNHACIYRTSESTLVVDQRIASSGDKQTSQNLTFTFDRVFWSIPSQQRRHLHPADMVFGSSMDSYECAGQDRVFDCIAKPMVDLALQGFNSCVFAFGQTGSGKSYSIFGPPASVEERGLAPRLAGYLFRCLNRIQRERNMTEAFRHCNNTGAEESIDTCATGSSNSNHNASLGYSYSVGVGCFEIYNEKLFDLLSRAASRPSTRQAPSAPPSQPITRVNSLQAPPSPVLQMTPADVSFGDDLDMVPICSPTNDSPGEGFFASAATPATEGSTISDDDADLRLGASNAASAATPQNQWLSSTNALRIRHDPTLGTYVEGLRTELVEDGDSLILLIQQALRHRLTAANHVHDASSRSHAVLTLSLTQEDTISGSRKSSTIHVVDLAGSERGARHGASGQQLYESKKINLSLTTLRRVIDLMVAGATSQRRKTPANHSTGIPLSSSTTLVSASSSHGPSGSPSVHLPVRDSKLTEVMSESLGGNSRTFMLATVSPHEHNINETLDSLRYCTKAKGIVNRMRPNEERIAVAVQAIQHEIERLRAELVWRQERVRLSDMEKWLQKRARVMTVLRHSNRERHVVCASLHDQCSAHTNQLHELGNVLESKTECKKELDELTSALTEVSAAHELNQESLRDNRQHIDAMRRLQRDAAAVVEELEAKPLPPAVRELLSAKKKCWRIAFLSAAGEYRWQQLRDEWLQQVHSLLRSCHTLEAHVDIVDGILDGTSPEGATYERIVQRLKDTSIAVAQGYEAYYRNSLDLRQTLDGQHAEIDYVRQVELREAQHDVDMIESHFQPAIAQAGLLVFELQRQYNSVVEEGEAAVAKYHQVEKEIEHLHAAIAEREMESEDVRVHFAAILRAGKELSSSILGMEPDVQQLQRDVLELSDENHMLEEELHLLEKELMDCDASAHVAVRHLVDAEHATRRLCLPDAVATIADTPLAAGILSVERVSHALTTPRRLQGSLDCAARSRSQDFRIPIPGATPRQHYNPFSRTPSRTPLTWKTQPFTPTPSATRHLGEASPKPEAPVALYTEDF